MIRAENFPNTFGAKRGAGAGIVRDQRWRNHRVPRSNGAGKTTACASSLRPAPLVRHRLGERHRCGEEPARRPQAGRLPAGTRRSTARCWSASTHVRRAAARHVGGTAQEAAPEVLEATTFKDVQKRHESSRCRTASARASALRTRSCTSEAAHPRRTPRASTGADRRDAKPGPQPQARAHGAHSSHILTEISETATASHARHGEIIASGTEESLLARSSRARRPEPGASASGGAKSDGDPYREPVVRTPSGLPGITEVIDAGREDEARLRRPADRDIRVELGRALVEAVTAWSAGGLGAHASRTSHQAVQGGDRARN